MFDLIDHVMLYCMADKRTCPELTVCACKHVRACCWLLLSAALLKRENFKRICRNIGKLS